MGAFRRDGRLRPGTVWIVFVVALLAGAVAGWAYFSWTHRSLVERAHDVEKEARDAVQKLTR